MGALNDFISELGKNKPAMANRWRIQFGDIPTESQNIGGRRLDSKTASMWAKSVSIPGLGMMINEDTAFTAAAKLPYLIQFDEMRMQFICSEKATEWHTFVEWMQYVGDPMGNVVDKYPEDMVCDIEVIMQDGGDPAKDILKINLVNAYPSFVGPISLDHSPDNVANFDVSFNFQYWELAK